MPTTRFIGQIGDMNLADDRRDMVLAVRFEADVLQRDDLVVAVRLLESALQQRNRILVIAAEKFPVRADDPLRGAEQPLAARVVAGPADQRADRLHGLLSGRALHSGRRLGAPFGQGNGRG